MYKELKKINQENKNTQKHVEWFWTVSFQKNK